MNVRIQGEKLNLTGLQVCQIQYLVIMQFTEIR